MATVPFITRIMLRDYKSIAACDVSLGPLAFLVGPNGAGKSNFLDALRFISDTAYRSLDTVLRERGGSGEILRRGSSAGQFGIRLEFNVSPQDPNQAPIGGSYAVLISQHQHAGYEVDREECVVRDPSSPSGRYAFRVEQGRISQAYTSKTDWRDPASADQVLPPATKDRLYLSNAAGLAEFWPVYDALTEIAIYHLNLQSIRGIQNADSGDALAFDGSNTASALSRLGEDDRQRVLEYLSRVDPSIQDITVREFESYLAIEFIQRSKRPEAPHRFSSLHISDGTLHALGVLLALFHTAQRGIPLVGIEEPGTGLHPAASGALLDAMREASHRVQVIATSHSPDLLDDKDLGPDAIRAVTADDGETHIGPLDDVGRSALRDRLYTVGELLRLDRLSPVNGQSDARDRSADLFVGL